MKKLLLLIAAVGMGPFAHANFTVTLPTDIDGDSEPLVQDLASCRTEVNQVIEWGAEENQAQAVKLSELRKQHEATKEHFVTTLQHYIDVTADWTNHGMNAAYENSVKNAVATAAACIQSNEGMYYPHNIALLMVPEQTRIECYEWSLTLPGYDRPTSKLLIRKYVVPGQSYKFNHARDMLLNLGPLLGRGHKF